MLISPLVISLLQWHIQGWLNERYYPSTILMLSLITPKDPLDRSLLLLLHLSISLREGCRFVMGFENLPGIWSMLDSFLSPLPVAGWQWLTWSPLSLPIPSQLPLVPCSLVSLAPTPCIFSFCPISSQHHELGGS